MFVHPFIHASFTPDHTQVSRSVGAPVIEMRGRTLENGGRAARRDHKSKSIEYPRLVASLFACAWVSHGYVDRQGAIVVSSAGYHKNEAGCHQIQHFTREERGLVDVVEGKRKGAKAG